MRHGLPRNKLGRNFFNVTLRGDTLVEGRRLHRTRTDGVATDATANEVGGNGLR